MSVRQLDVERIALERESRTDEVVVEEPLEIRVAGDTLAITMRTPGNDRELVLGFLFGEGIIRSAADVSSLAPCGRLGDEGRENTIEVTLAPGVRLPARDGTDAPFAQRGTLTTSSCGVCGRRSIDDLLARVAPVADGEEKVSAATIARVAAGIAERQPIFVRTGGCHAASLATIAGDHVVTFEDVGRHNAVDKVIGSRVRVSASEVSLSAHVLFVSGRASFEIVQKAIAARVPVVASVSAPSSLAVDLARRANVTLAGFVRGEKMTIYAGAGRVTG